MRVKRTLGLASCLLVLGGFSASFFANRAPHNPENIAMLSDRLFEFGAVDFIHSGYDGESKALFDCVASGKELSDKQSMKYRKLYQQILLEKQGLFARLDANIALRRDEGLERTNNAGGMGIAGLHDHHDASAANNAKDIETGLLSLQSTWPLKRAIIANDIYKDLTDLMVHMAPAAHSVGLLEHDRMPMGLGQDFTAFYVGLKRAQAALINSPEYWAGVEAALVAYRALIAKTQSEVRQHNGSVLHALSGKWLALQTIAPRLNANSPSAKNRQDARAPCPIDVL